MEHCNMPVFARKIAPKKLDIEGMIQALADAVIAYTADVKDDFEKTTETWEHRVRFVEHLQVGPNVIESSVLTDDEIYGYVDRGTRPHLILPVRAKALRFQSGYKAKTVPNVIGSQAGGPFGDDVFSLGVRHPGTEPRNFDRNIYDKWKPIFKQRMLAAMKVAAKVSGHEI
jgi:hypothetical protein